MTIAEPIQTLEYIRDSGVFPFNTKAGVLYTAESIDVAIDTMHKYQKIQEIHKKWFCDYTSAEAYTKISEVLNGNDD